MLTLIAVAALAASLPTAQRTQRTGDPWTDPGARVHVLYTAHVRYARLISGPGESVVEVVDVAQPCGPAARALVEDCVRTILKEGFLLPFGETESHFVAPGTILTPVTAAPIE